MHLDSCKKRFTLSFLLSLNIHIGLFLFFSPHFKNHYPSYPSYPQKIVYYKQKVISKSEYSVSKPKQKKEKENPAVTTSTAKTIVRKNDYQEAKKKLTDRSKVKLVRIKRKNKLASTQEIDRQKSVIDSRQVVSKKQKKKKISEKEILAKYYQIVSKQIKKKAIYPEEAKRWSEEGLIYISFILLKDGHLKKIKVRISSGNEYLDKAALQSIKDAAPFPPFPVQIKEKQLCLNISISFEIK